MICCTVIAFLLALLARPVLGWSSRPLAWRLQSTSAATKATRRLRSFRHAGEGIRFVIRHEMNMRIHLAAAAAVIGAGLWLGLDVSEWRWLILAIALVLMAEAVNTAIEQACDAVSREFNPGIKAAKDVGAGAVLIVAMAAALIGASIFLPHLALMLSGSGAFYCGAGP